MSRCQSTPPKRRLSLPDDEHTGKRPRSSEEAVTASAGNSRRTQTTASAQDTRTRVDPRTVEQQPHARRRSLHAESDAASSSPTSSSAAGQSSPRPAVSSSLGPRPTWNTRSSSTAAAPSAERPRENRSLTESRDVRRTDEQADSPPGNRSSSQPQPNASSRSYFPSTGTALPVQNKQAAFVNKLYQMLEDPRIARSGLLEWAKDGKSFICNNPAEFAREVLPNFFKHNNWQSFVRQLNMYSFNKVSDLYSTANVDPTAWEFRHSLFQRGEPGLLSRIKRKSNRHVQHDSATPSPGEEDLKPMSWQQAARPSSSHRSGIPNGYLGPVPEDDGGGGHHHYFTYGQSRPVSSGYNSAMSPSESPMSHSAIYPRARSRSSAQAPQAAPSLSGPTHSPSYSEAAYYNAAATRSPNLETLTHHVAALQDTVYNLRSILHHERQTSARTNLDLSSYLLRMTNWLLASDGQGIPRELLDRQRAELLQRYEALRDSELLSVAPTSEETANQYPTQRSYAQPSRELAKVYYQSSEPDRVRSATEEYYSTSTSYYHMRPHSQASAYNEGHQRAGELSRSQERDLQHSRELHAAQHDAGYYDQSARTKRPSMSRHTHGFTPSSATEREHKRTPPGAENPPKASLRNLLH